MSWLPEEAQDLIRNWHARGWTPMGRLGAPEDVGNVVTLFCSAQAGWIAGRVIYADRGASLMNPEVPTQIQLGELDCWSSEVRLRSVLESFALQVR